jgi:Fic family protein
MRQLAGRSCRSKAAFERRLQAAVAVLDQRYPSNEALDEDGLAAVIDLCAWAHAEWVRIHPFGNGNGRTARVWANAPLMRYGLPPDAP